MKSFLSNFLLMASSLSTINITELMDPTQAQLLSDREIKIINKLYSKRQ